MGKYMRDSTGRRLDSFEVEDVAKVDDRVAAFVADANSDTGEALTAFYTSVEDAAGNPVPAYRARIVINPATGEVLDIVTETNLYGGIERAPYVPGAKQDDEYVAALVNDPASATRGALEATYAEKWRPSTSYIAGDTVLNPNGALVKAKVTFTSGTTYNSADWNAASVTSVDGQTGAVDTIAFAFIFGEG